MESGGIFSFKKVIYTYTYVYLHNLIQYSFKDSIKSLLKYEIAA